MLSVVIRKRASKDEPEKPFWISFADMMMALMVLFLLVMTVALLAVTKTVSDLDRQRLERDAAITELLNRVATATRKYGVVVDRERHVVDFKDRAHFASDSSELTAGQAQLVRQVVAQILQIARDPLGQRWFKQVLAEGFTDRNGTYLYNLNLSLQRSQRVLCVLLAKDVPGLFVLSAPEQRQIRRLFLVGGYSYNSARQSLEQSRRVELQLEFLSIGEAPQASPNIDFKDPGKCQIGLQ